MARMVRGGTTKPDASGLNCVGIMNTVTPTPRSTGKSTWLSLGFIIGFFMLSQE